MFATCFPTDGRIKRFSRSECPSTDGQTRQWIVGVGGASGRGVWGVRIQPPLLPNVTECKVEFAAPPPSVQNWPSERTCERHDGMSFAVRASLGDSCDVYRPASMTVGGRGGGPALFRQELGLSSDSKIRLIYDISTSVFPPAPLTLADKCPAGRR